MSFAICSGFVRVSFHGRLGACQNRRKFLGSMPDESLPILIATYSGMLRTVQREIELPVHMTVLIFTFVVDGINPNCASFCLRLILVAGGGGVFVDFPYTPLITSTLCVGILE